MNVKKIAAELGKLGINISKIEVSDDDALDHEITITETISIQVAMYGNHMSVTHMLDEESFMCHPPTKSVQKIAATVRECLGLVAA